MLPSFARKTVEVIRPAKAEQRGTIVDDWKNATVHQINGCDFQKISSAVNFADQSATASVRWQLRLPPNSDIEAGDRVSVDGRTYALNGVPMAWESPTGRVSHIECELVEWRR